MGVEPPVRCEPQFRSPAQVHWPEQFVACDGHLLTVGSLNREEAPYGSGVCLLCGSGNLASNAHLADEGHLDRRRRACEDYLCYWQELTAPDDRPYYYDHVSHTWSFARPRRLSVPASSLGQSPDGPDDEELELLVCSAVEAVPRRGPEGLRVDAAGPDTWSSTEFAAAAEAAEQRENEILSSRGYLTINAPYPGFQCEFCGKGLNTEWSAQQHLQSMSGRKGHPRVPASLPGQAAGPVAVGPCAAPLQPILDPERDVEEAFTGDMKYWYNPRTVARKWSREELIQANVEFYQYVDLMQSQPGQQAGPRGETRWWIWQGPSGTARSAWTLEELYDSVQRLQDDGPPRQN